MTRNPDELVALSMRLWPHHGYLREEWLRAVGVVRSTSGGWVLDAWPIPQPVPTTYDPPLRIRA